MSECKEWLESLGTMLVRASAVTLEHEPFCACTLCNIRGLLEIAHNQAMQLMDDYRDRRVDVN